MHLYFIGPLRSDPLFPAKQRIIQEVARQHDFAAHFPFSAGVFQDVPEIIAEIRSCRFVLADLSRERPSCYFELGVAEAVGAAVALIAQDGTPIHQTRKRSVTFYSNLNDYRACVATIIADHQTA